MKENKNAGNKHEAASLGLITAYKRGSNERCAHSILNLVPNSFFDTGGNLGRGA